jgi:hypothetical protein
LQYIKRNIEITGFGGSKMTEEEYFVDFFPNHIKQGITKYAEDYLRKRYEQELTRSIARWGELDAVSVQIKHFETLFRQARSLYVDGYFQAGVALCGMTIEALCISVAEDRVPERPLKNELMNPEKPVRDKINKMKKYFKGDWSAFLLHDVLDKRKEYLHLHKLHIDSKDTLECINRLHLVLLAEYGLVVERGKFRISNNKDIKEKARQMGIILH